MSLLKRNITKSLLLFSLPMILGNIFQQFYNIADTFIVGKYIGTSALGAVGSTYSLMSFLTSIILGLCMGSGILFSMYYGAKKEHQLKNSIFISFISIGLLSIIIEIFCFIFIHPILNLLNTPLEIYELTYQYVFIIFFGLIFTFLYNYFASLLRAIGNSKAPLFFLALSSLINIILDIVFIVEFHLGIQGVALATVIAQIMSALSLIIYILKAYKHFLPHKEDCYFSWDIFKKISDFSLLTCLQQSVMNFGILMIQGLVNSFGIITMSAFATAVKIDSLAYMPVQDFGNAFSTFIAQNIGAHQHERIKKGLKSAFITSTIFCIIISIFVFVFSKELMLIFVNKQDIEVILQGMQYLKIEGSCYIGIGYLFLLYGYYRGIGKPFMSVILTIISLGTRVAIAYAFSHNIGIIMIWLAIPIGWFLADITGISYGIKHYHWLK